MPSRQLLQQVIALTRRRMSFTANLPISLSVAMVLTVQSWQVTVMEKLENGVYQKLVQVGIKPNLQKMKVDYSSFFRRQPISSMNFRQLASHSNLAL